MTNESQAYWAGYNACYDRKTGNPYDRETTGDRAVDFVEGYAAAGREILGDMDCASVDAEVERQTYE
jgi:hypothetical protein